MMECPVWDNRYPEKQALRSEIRHMLNAFLDVLFEHIPESSIAGIYFKGSGQKRWDSPLDYVPEISDVDIHLLLQHDEDLTRYIGTAEQALAIQAGVEERYFGCVCDPLHFPRPQLVILNDLIHEADFIPSPVNTIEVLHGAAYPAAEPSLLKRLPQIDAERLRDEERFLAGVALHIVDRPARYLWQVLRNLVWHVSPVGPRVLSIKGRSYDEAWGINRSVIVRELADMGETALVRDYMQFYLSAWDYFLAGYKDTNAGRSAVVSGLRALRRGVEMAKQISGSRREGEA